MITEQKGAQDYVFKGVSKTVGYAPVAMKGWSIALTLEKNEFLAAASEQKICKRLRG